MIYLKPGKSFRRLTISVVLVFVLSIGIVGMLFLLADGLKKRPGSFLRVFPSHAVEEVNTMLLPYNSYYLAGVDSGTIYFGNHAAPLYVLESSIDLYDTMHAHLDVPGIMDQKFWSVRVSVEPPFFYVYDGAVPIIYKGNISDWTAVPLQLGNEYFLDLAPIDQCSFFIKSLNKEGNRSILGRITTTAPYYTFTDSLLRKQVDGVFCTDGKLVVNKDIPALLHVYRYRNEFLIMDTLLNLINTGHTIDTTSLANISVGKSGTASKLSSPPLVVNDNAASWGRWLFVHSDLLARNEHPDALNKASVIDVYDLFTKEYKFSFYVFDHEGEKMKDFKVTRTRMVVMFDTYVKVFDFSPAYFKNDIHPINDITRVNQE